MKIPVYTFPEMFNGNWNCNDQLVNFNINKIKFSDIPYIDKKNKGLYIIDMYYKNNCIIFQLPRLKLNSINENIITIDVPSKINEYIIKPLEEHICEMVHKYSEKWFNGKHFTMNKIVNSLDSQIKKDERVSRQGEQNFTLNLILNKNTLLYNRSKTLIKLNDINNDPDIELITLIRLSHLEFFENKFTYILILEQAKVFIPEKLTCYSIIETPEDESCSNCSEEQYSLDDSKQNFF